MTRVAIVTGGARNIGRAVALELARQGWQVVVGDLDGDAAQTTARDMGELAIGVRVDIASRESAEALVAAALARFGRIDALVNNAAKFTELAYRPFDEIPDAEWDAVLHTNLTGTLYCIRACVPHMKERRWGRIVNVSSGTYRMGRPNFLHYVSSKAGLMGMSRSLAASSARSASPSTPCCPAWCSPTTRGADCRRAISRRFSRDSASPRPSSRRPSQVRSPFSTRRLPRSSPVRSSQSTAALPMAGKLLA